MAAKGAPPGQAAGDHGASASRAGSEDLTGTPRVVTSETLLGGASQLAILHDRTLYFLRQTRYGKLILTK